MVPGERARLRQTTYALMGASAALLFFASVLTHEISHSLVARLRGERQRVIALFAFCGLARPSEARAPSDELVIALVGPLANFAVACACRDRRSGAGHARITAGAVVAYLGLVNLLLGTFNLLPGLPLDGGRAVRSVSCARLGALRARR